MLSVVREEVCFGCESRVADVAGDTLFWESYNEIRDRLQTVLIHYQALIKSTFMFLLISLNLFKEYSNYNIFNYLFLQAINRFLCFNFGLGLDCRCEL